MSQVKLEMMFSEGAHLCERIEQVPAGPLPPRACHGRLRICRHRPVPCRSSMLAYPHFLQCSTSVATKHRGESLLHRHGAGSDEA